MPTSGYFGVGAERVFKFIVIALIIQGALLHARLFLKAFQRHQTTFTSIVTYVTIGLVVILMVMLVLPLMTDEFVTYRPLYWRVVVALAILSAVGTALLPLVNALFAPKRPPHRPLAAPYGAAPYGTAPYGSAPLSVAAPAARARARSPALPRLGRPRRHRHPLRRHPHRGPPSPTASRRCRCSRRLAGLERLLHGQPSPGARFWFTEGASAPTAPAAQGHDGYPPAPPLPPQQHS
jgi:hypothetical protein